MPKLVPGLSTEDPQLNIVSDRTRIIVQKNPDYDTKTAKRDGQHVLNIIRTARQLDDTVPVSLIHSLESQSEVLNVSQMYDPTFGKLLEFFSIKHHDRAKVRQGVVAYVSGTVGSILNVSLVEPSIVNQSRHLEVPRFSNTISLTMDDTIRQIESYQPCIPKESQGDDHILVRTETKVYVIHVQYQSQVSSSISISLVTTLDTGTLKKNCLANVCWSGHARRVFYVVDVKGYTFRVKLKHSVDPVVKELVLKSKEAEDEKIFENSLELSRWRKVVSIGKETILVASRTKMSKVSCDSLESERIVTSETWSKIQDITVPKFQDKYMFMLTSKEIIWLDVSDSYPVRVLAWKHFLSDKDPSLKFGVYKVRSKFICVVYSAMSPLVYCCQFGMKDGIPCCLSRPSLLFVSDQTDVPIESLAFVEVNKSLYKPHTRHDEFFSQEENEMAFEDRFGLCVLRQNFEVSFNIVGYGESKKVAKESEQVKIDFDRLHDEVKQGSVRPYSGSFFFKLQKSQMNPIVEKITKVKRDTEEDEAGIIQQYKQDLAAKIKELSEGYTNATLSSISELAGVPDHVEDTAQLDTILEQLSDEFGDKDLELSDIIDTYFTNSKLVKDPPPRKSIEGLYRHLNINYYKRNEVKPQTRVRSVKEMATLIMLSSMKFKPKQLQQMSLDSYTKNYNEANTSAKAILDDWDTNYDEQEEEDVIRPSQRETQRTQDSAPSIIITSQDTSTQKKKHKRKDLRRLLTQNSQASFSQPTPPQKSHLSQTPTQTPTQADLPTSSPQTPHPIPSLTPSSQSSQTSTASQKSQKRSLSQISQRPSQRPSQRSSQKHKKKKKKGFA